MRERDSVPAIRFAGFTDEWEQRKVSDVAEIIVGGTPNTKVESYWEPKEIPWLSSGEVHKKYITFTDDMISKEGMDNSSAKMVKENSVLIALAGQGKTRGTVAINRISLTTNQSIAVMMFDENIIPEFIFCNLENRYDEIRRMSSGDGSRGGLNKQLVGDIEIPYTAKLEQKIIGSFFTTLDHLITLHQRKHSRLCNIKKSMLERMFPKEGVTVPEIRFAGFTDAWEQRKLGELCAEFKSGEFIKATEIKETGAFPVYGGNGLRGYADGYNHDGEYALIGRQGALCGNLNYSSGKAYFTEHAITVSANRNNDTKFLFYLLDLMNLGQYSGQSAQPGLAVGKLIELEAMIPRQTEQLRIGDFFWHLDHLITLHQRELERLQNIKKACLEKMFV